MTRQISIAIWAELGILALIWGGSFLAIRTALDDVPPLTSVAHRVVWGAAALWLVAIWRRSSFPRAAGVWGALFVMGVLNNVIPFSLMAWGQLHVTTGLTSILNAASAIWGVLVAALVFRDERLTLRRAAGVALGFLGVAIAIGLDAFGSVDVRSLAQFAILGGTLSYAFAGSWARATLGGLEPTVAAAGMLTGASLVMVPLALAVEGWPSFDLPARAWAAIGYYSVVATALAYLLYYRILRNAGAGNLLLVTLLIPPVAIVLGAVVRGESLDATAYAGFALLALGLLVLDGRIGVKAAKSAKR